VSPYNANYHNFGPFVTRGLGQITMEFGYVSSRMVCLQGLFLGRHHLDPLTNIKQCQSFNWNFEWLCYSYHTYL